MNNNILPEVEVTLMLVGLGPFGSFYPDPYHLPEEFVIPLTGEQQNLILQSKITGEIAHLNYDDNFNFFYTPGLTDPSNIYQRKVIAKYTCNSQPYNGHYFFSDFPNNSPEQLAARLALPIIYENPEPNHDSDLDWDADSEPER